MPRYAPEVTLIDTADSQSEKVYMRDLVNPTLLGHY